MTSLAVASCASDLLLEAIPSDPVGVAILVARTIARVDEDPEQERSFPEPIQKAIKVFRDSGDNRRVRRDVGKRIRHYYQTNGVMPIPEFEDPDI